MEEEGHWKKNASGQEEECALPLNTDMKSFQAKGYM